MDCVETVPTLAGGSLGGWAVFLDIDGTLLEFANRPGDVVVPRDLIETLRRLHDRLGGALALISGRTLESIDGLFASLRLPVAGEYGIAMRADHRTEWLAPPLSQSARDILSAIAARHGLPIEHKNRAATLHYRHDPALGPLIETALRPGWHGDDDPPHVIRGHATFDVMMRADAKAAAIAAFLALAPFAGRRPIFIGDDVADRPGFELVNERGGRSCQVGGPRSGSNPATDYFDSPMAVRAWLAGLVEPS